jgi:SAM-dependent methyltransferase
MPTGVASRTSSWQSGWADTVMTAFWEEQEQVERFAAREPDHRLAELLKSYDEPALTRVLDLGCAAGRNTVLLARLGFDFYALDSSASMIEKTRERVAAIAGRNAAVERVRVGVMEALHEFQDQFFHVVVALGVYHQAESLEQWDQALNETGRVLAVDGLLVSASFSPASRPQGAPLIPVPGQTHMYHGFHSGPLCVLDAQELDRAMASRGLLPDMPTETVEVPTDEGYRVTVNGLYRKRG